MSGIMIVGEAWGSEEARLGQPFVGYSGQLLRSMMRQAGLPWDECYLTNVFNFQPTGNKLEALAGLKNEAIPGMPQLGQKLWVHQRYQAELDRLYAEIKQMRPNVVIALGATPLWALCKQTGIKKYRGTPIWSTICNVKVFPTYHPAAIARQWKLRPIGVADLIKARAEAEFPQIKRPRRLIYLEPSLADIADFYNRYIEPATVVAADIETKQGTITEIGFAPSQERAIVIPFYDHERSGSYWPTVGEEIEAWNWVRRICQKPIVGQNFSYDIQYLWGKMGIEVPEIADDTMILHHAMFPEVEKSLGFLGSLYTNEPSWKFMRADNETLKQED